MTLTLAVSMPKAATEILMCNLQDEIVDITESADKQQIIEEKLADITARALLYFHWWHQLRDLPSMFTKRFRMP